MANEVRLRIIWLSLSECRATGSALRALRQIQPEQFREFHQGFFQHRHLEAVHDGLALFVAVHEPGLAKHGEVGGHRRFGDGEVIRQLSGGFGTLTKQLQHLPASRVGEGLEHGAHI